MLLLKKKIMKFNIQMIVVSLCVLAVCIGTQQIQTVAWNTGIIEFSRDSIGILMAVIIFTNYKWEDFVKYKVPYLVWGVVGIVLGVALIPAAIEKRFDFLAFDTIVISLGMYLMGFCIIHTIISIFVEKYRPKMYLPLFIIWMLMLLLMVFSKSEYLWPECYFVLFFCYYMTRQTPVQRTNVIMGVVNGIVLGYIVIQAHSLLFRPYDRLRYYGNFCNPNHNCMFLCMCLAAILAKLLFLTKADQKKAIKIFYFLLAGSCYSFICMTICRSGYLSAFVITIFFLVGYCKMKGKLIFIRMGLLLVFIFTFSLPLTYLAVRYIPTIHPHVLFYFQEGYSEDRVHSWDERDSDKYITFQQMLQGIFGRFGTTLKSLENFRGEDKDLNNEELLKITSKDLNFPSAAFTYVKNDTYIEKSAVDPDKIPILEGDKSKNAFMVRFTIYKWYFTHLSLRGMPYDEQGFQLTETHWVQDTHNIYLDYGINFGYPVMILFAVFIWWGIGRLTAQGMQRRDAEKMACLLLALVPPVFGMFEFAWGAGTISTVAFYMVFKEMLSIVESK